MEFKIKSVNGQPVEKTAEELAAKQANVQQEQKQVDIQMSDTDILKYLKEKHNREYESIDKLFEKEKEIVKEEIPEDIAAFLQYREKTGRGMEDYLRLNRDLSSTKDHDLLREYLMATNEGLDASDIDIMMEEYAFDEDIDDEKEIKGRKLAMKREVAKARKFFEEQKEMYKAPIESKANSISDEDKKNLEAYKQYINESKSYEEESNRKREWFTKQTDAVFGNEFKGFEFTLADNNKVVYNPGNVAEMKASQSDLSTFVGKFMDEGGLIKDAVGYHRALAIANNPDAFAKFFFEQGQASKTEETIRKLKNINMDSERKINDAGAKGGLQFKAVDQGSSGSGLRIKQ